MRSSGHRSVTLSHWATVEREAKRAFSIEIAFPQLVRRLTLHHCKIMAPRDYIFCGMADYWMKKCTFDPSACCRKADMIAPMATPTMCGCCKYYSSTEYLQVVFYSVSFNIFHLSFSYLFLIFSLPTSYKHSWRKFAAMRWERCKRM